MSNFLEALSDNFQNLVAVLVALGLTEAFDTEEFLSGCGGEVGYGQKGFLVEDHEGEDVVLTALCAPPVHKGLNQFRMEAAGVGGSAVGAVLSRRFGRGTGRLMVGQSFGRCGSTGSPTGVGGSEDVPAGVGGSAD